MIKNNINIKIKGKVLVIAEAGINHCGVFNDAKRFIDAAKESGADFIKFHAAYSNRITNKSKYNNWKKGSNYNKTIRRIIKKYV